MAQDKYDELGPMLSRIGEEAAAIVGGNPEGLYLYIEVGDGWVGPSVYRDEGNIVRYYDATLELSELIEEAWEAEDADIKNRWSVMEYVVQNGKLDARFRYPDETDVEKYDERRRQDALEKRFGNKPVIYPPMPGQSQELN